jgi:fructose-1,6-bisphosphatase-3
MTAPTLTAEQELTILEPLARQFPTLDAALAEIARLSAESTLPKGAIHVISDIHGDDVKLRHVINNASGTIRPLLVKLFTDKLKPDELQQLIVLCFYPREMLEEQQTKLSPEGQQQFCRRYLPCLFEVARTLAPRYSRQRVQSVLPPDFNGLVEDLLHEKTGGRAPEYYDAMIVALAHHGRLLHFTHLVVRLIRNLAIDELIIGGDCWDRGHRGDRVVDYLMRQPDVSFVWGNHDAAWLGACLGQEACIAHVLRISTRYRRLSQLEEGYGVNLQPLEALVRSVYKDDPASCFPLKNYGMREKETMARLEKAAAVMQFKLEGQTMARNPQWGLEKRRLLHRMDLKAGTIEIDGVKRTLKDRLFPTIDPANPYELSADEKTCLERIKRSFYDSEKLWVQIKWLLSIGKMYLIRDGHLIFHGCMPVDEKGAFLSLGVKQPDGSVKEFAGKPLFDALDEVLARCRDRANEADKDLCWYLWCGARSPLFGKDRIATFEIDLVAEKETHEEKKNPYFQLIHEVPFCDRVLKEFHVDPARGLIVNGHVPVKIEKGEDPVKRSGKAITIDGAFSDAYGDHGYTLLLESDRTLLAEHHKFESVQAAINKGEDIIPKVREVRNWGGVRRVADTEQGAELGRRLFWLERLVQAYRDNRLRQR